MSKFHWHCSGPDIDSEEHSATTPSLGSHHSPPAGPSHEHTDPEVMYHVATDGYSWLLATKKSLSCNEINTDFFLEFRTENLAESSRILQHSWELGCIPNLIAGDVPIMAWIAAILNQAFLGEPCTRFMFEAWLPCFHCHG